MLMGTPESVLTGADALIVCTEWQQFKAPDFDLIHQRLNAPVIFDGRNLYDAERLARSGFKYFPMGRGESRKLPIPHQQWSAARRRRLMRTCPALSHPPTIPARGIAGPVAVHCRGLPAGGHRFRFALRAVRPGDAAHMGRRFSPPPMASPMPTTLGLSTLFIWLLSLPFGQVTSLSAWLPSAIAGA